MQALPAAQFLQFLSESEIFFKIPLDKCGRVCYNRIIPIHIKHIGEHGKPKEGGMYDAESPPMLRLNLLSSDYFEYI